MPDVLPDDTGPAPPSFLPVSRNPTLSDRFAHLGPPPRRKAKEDRPEPQGKRWARRRDNAKFMHNPHVAFPSSTDSDHPLQLPLSTFPHPLPSYLPRTLLLPSSRPPPSLPSTSSAGLFSLSLRGARRTLRARSSSAHLVEAIEAHLTAWLHGGTYLNPDQAKGLLHFPGDPVGGREDIREVGREPGRLVWAVKAALEGGFERYVVHCVARWHAVVSFSKETDGHRLTYLLRPNVTRPDPRVTAASQTLATPPATDTSDFQVSDAGLSDSNTTDGSGYNTRDTSDIDSVSGDLSTGARSLSDIEESRSSSPASWSDLGGSDFAIDCENGADDPGFAASVESLSLSTHAELDDGFATSARSRLQSVAVATRAGLPADVGSEERSGNAVPSRARTDRVRVGALYPRSASSPSPARIRRLPTARKLGARRRKAKNGNKALAGAMGSGKGSFYEYVFA